MGNGSRSAVEVKDHPVIPMTRKIPYDGVEPFCTQGVGLEEGEGGDSKGQPQDLLGDEILSVQDVARIALDHIRKAVVDGM